MSPLEIPLEVRKEMEIAWCQVKKSYKKGDKTDCSNYRGISVLPTMYKILSNILLSKLTPYAEETIGDHQ
jgi:hypothetical protein